MELHILMKDIERCRQRMILLASSTSMLDSDVIKASTELDSYKIWKAVILKRLLLFFALWIDDLNPLPANKIPVGVVSLIKFRPKGTIHYLMPS